MRLRCLTSRLFRLFNKRRRKIRPSIEEMTRAREIMSRISMNSEMDIVEKAAKLKAIIEGKNYGERED